jgi:hypothetical protein
MRRISIARTAAALGATATLAASCGGGGANPGGVAHLGTATTAATSGATPAVAAASPSTDPGAQAIAFAACIRAHGVPNFPDPVVTQTHNPSGGSASVGLRVPPAEINSPSFKAAQKDCSSLLPSGGPSPQQTLSPRVQAQYLKAVACFRAHGLPSFPDPVFTAGGVHIPDPGAYSFSSPAVKAAIQACRSVIPAGALSGSS